VFGISMHNLLLLFVVAVGGAHLHNFHFHFGSDWITGSVPIQRGEFEFKGQSLEDKNAYSTFFNAPRYESNGIILELGALDGDLYSNSNFFVRYLGWKAIHIEGSPHNYEALIRNRPESLNINAAICKTHRRVHYIDGDVAAVRGIYEFMAPAFKKRWHPGWNDENIHEAITLECLPLCKILRMFNITHIDFWVLDVEGGEFEILQSFFGISSCDTITVDVLSIEFDGSNIPREHNITSFLSHNKYVSLKMPGDNQNVWFVRDLFGSQSAPDFLR
jgi:FkbM family methyltransferase